MRSIDALIQPKSVAVIGASNDKTRIGGRPVHYLVEAGFAGSIYPINPGRDEVQGLRAYPSVEDVQGPVDCAIISTPTQAVLPAVQSCARKGVRAVIIFSAGFAEMGGEGQRLQDEIHAVARAHDMRILGPNCLGMFNSAARSFLTFSGIYEDVVGTSGRLGLVSQSGGYAGELVKQAKRLGLTFGSWITTGNEADVEAGEIIAAYAHDPEIDVILAYLEGARDAETLISGLEAARSVRKPVIVQKVGGSSQGALAAAAHTASQVGTDEVYDAVFARYGAYRARSTEEMLDLAYACSKGVYPQGKRLIILTGSGGIGVQAADFAQDEGLEVTALSENVRAEIRKLVPNAGTNNPVDMTGVLAHDPELLAQALELALASGEYDMAYVSIGVIAGMANTAPRLLDSLTPVAARYPAIPKVVAVMASPEIVSAYEAGGYLSFAEPARALRSLAGLYWFTQAWARSAPTVVTLEPMPVVAASKAFSDVDAKAIVAAAGVRVPTEQLVTPMSRDGTECFLSARQDPVFGTTLTFGLGGVACELYRDVTTQIAPIDQAEALEMIAATKGSALLQGYRGRPKADVAALADAIVSIAALAQANRDTIGSIEINPLLVLDDGQGAIALDVLITPRYD